MLIVAGHATRTVKGQALPPGKPLTDGAGVRLSSATRALDDLNDMVIRSYEWRIERE